MPIASQRTRFRDGLLDLIHGQVRAPNTYTVLKWLAARLGGQAALLDRHGKPSLVAPSMSPWAPADDELVKSVITGARRTEVLALPSRTLTLVPVGAKAPHQILAASKQDPFTPAEAELVTRVADVVALVHDLAEVADQQPRLRQADEEVRRASIQLLLAGQPELARRCIAPISSASALSLADTVRVYLVSAEDDSEQGQLLADLIAVLEDPHTFTGPCPAHPGHVLVLVPVSSPRHEETDAALRRFTDTDPQRHLSVSCPHRIDSTADAYREAHQGLGVARHLPQRVWRFDRDTSAGAVLGDRAGLWAARYLQPVLDLEPAQREPLLRTVWLTLRFPAVQVADMLGLHRNTVTARRNRINQLLGLRSQCLRERAVLELALQIHSRQPAQPARQDAGVRLAELLTHSPLRSWARAFLAPVINEPAVAHLLAVWLSHDASIDRTAQHLDLHPQTVRRRLRRAEDLLGRSLLGNSPTGAYDIAIALAALGNPVVLPDRPR